MAASDFERYKEALRKASLLAQRELAVLWESLRGSDPAAIRAALVAAVPGIVAKYGDMAALAAAEYYEVERRQAGGGDFRAELADGAPVEQVEAAVRYACGHLFAEGGGDDGARPRAHASLFG